MRDAMMEKLTIATDFIKEKLDIKNRPLPKTAIVLGSGLFQFASKLKSAPRSTAVSFHEIPYFCQSTVEGHKGEFIYGFLDDETPLLVMNGRLHFYEGYEPSQIITPIRTLGLLGIKNIILTNASGAIGDNFEPGELMVIEDHINFTGHSPLMGKNLNDLGPRFVDMSSAYDPDFIEIAHRASALASVKMHQGVYVGVLGPCYETPAEIRMFKLLGAHAVGMSTVFETIAARHMGMRVLAIACLTNKAAGLSASTITHDEVMENNAKMASKLEAILTTIIKKI